MSKDPLKGKAYKKVTKRSLERLGFEGGRPPTEPTDDITKAVCNYLRIGAHLETACAVAGVSKPTLYEWMKKAIVKDEKGRATAQRHDNTFGRFLTAVERAAEESVVRDLANIDKCAMGQDWEYERYENDIKDAQTGEIVHSKGDLVLNGRGNPIPKKPGFAPDWHASAWRLERRHARKWSPTQNINQKVEGKLQGPQVVVHLPSNGREVKNGKS